MPGAAGCKTRPTSCNASTTARSVPRRSTSSPMNRFRRTARSGPIPRSSSRRITPPIPIPKRYRNTWRGRSNALKPAARWRMSSIPRAVTRYLRRHRPVRNCAPGTGTTSGLTAHHHIDRALHDGFQLLARHARAGADGNAVDGRGCQLRQHHGIGCWRQFAVLLRKPEAGGERLVEFGKSLQHHGADFGIGHSLRRRRHHGEATARARVAGEIDIERHRKDALQPPSDRQFVSEDVDHRRARVGAVARIALDVELALVAERAVKARPVHAGGGAEVVERGGGEAVFAKQIERLAERDFGLIGARPAAALWRDDIGVRRRPLSFLYHFAINSLTRFILCGTV